jgi:hypothetical protein
MTKTLKALTAAALAGACIAAPAEAFTPITIPPARVASKSLNQMILTGQVLVQFSSLGAGSFTATSGIELHGHWQKLGRTKRHVRHSPTRAVRRQVAIKLTHRGRQLIEGRRSGRIRVIIRGDHGDVIKTVLRLAR